MRLKTQSYLLIGGIAAMPVLVVGIAVVFMRIGEERRRSDFGRVIASFGRSAAVSDWKTLHRYDAQRPPGMDLAVVDPNDIVVYSSIEGLREGEAFRPAIMDVVRRGSDRSDFIFGRPFPELPPGHLAFMRTVPGSSIPSLVLGLAVRVAIAAMVAILVFAAAMSIYMLRSITRSVLALEAATRRVAAGELDLPIVVEGSNEISSLARSLDAMRSEIKEDSARRARFVMGVSHDLKTPLALVKGYAEALEEGIEGSAKERREHAAVIVAKADQLEGMIDDLIDFVRVDTGEWRAKLGPVELGPWLATFVRRIQADAALLGRSARGEIDLPEGARAVMDERLAARALENLVTNALRYTEEGGSVTVRARREGSRYLVEVADDGRGIPPEDLPHIFEPFFRGSSSRREQGMGLGLSVVKTVIETHGWAISVASSRGGGSAFTIAIPAQDA